MRTPSYLGLATVVVLGCEAPKPVVFVRMDSTAYTRPATGNAHATFVVTNMGSAAAYMEGCPPPDFAVDSGAPGRWVGYSSGLACLSMPIDYQVLRPGQSSAGHFDWDWPATYRVRVYYGRDQTDRYALQSAGGAFQIR